MTDAGVDADLPARPPAGPSAAAHVARALSHWPSGVAVLSSSNGSEVRITTSAVSIVQTASPVVVVSLSADDAGRVRLAPGDGVVLSVLGEQRDEDALARFDCALLECVRTRDLVLLIAAVRVAASRHGRPLVGWRHASWHLDVRHPCVESEAALEAFIANWTTGRLSKREWTHGAHVAACAYLAWGRSAAEAFAQMKPRILAYNAAVGTANTATSGYHETLTRFWALVIAGHLQRNPSDTRWQAVRLAVDRFGEDRDLHTLYYGHDIVRDVRARAEWVAPDRCPEGFPLIGAGDDGSAWRSAGPADRPGHDRSPAVS